MRKLSNLEISNISGAGEKSVSDMTPSDFLPYVAAYTAANWLWDFAGTWARSGAEEAAWGANAAFAVSSVAGLAGLAGGWFASKLVAQHVTPYL
jgi:hypothetical protein